MSRGTASFGLALCLALLACSSQPQKSGALVAQGEGIAITADELKARLDEQSPFIRSRYNTLERKKEFLDGLIRFELLARAAQQQGLDKDPDVQLAARKMMVQKLVQKTFAEGDALKEIPEADARKYYDEHKDEFQKPKRVRLLAIQVTAPASGPERAAKLAQAKKLLARVQAEEKKNPLAFGGIAREVSDDATSKASGGDLGFKSRDELEKQYGPAFATAAFALKDGEVALLDGPPGFLVVKLSGRQEELNRPFEQVRAQISSRLYREKRTKDFDEYVKKLREQARISVDEAALDKVAASPGPAAPPQLAPHGAVPPPPQPPPAAPAPTGGAK